MAIRFRCCNPSCRRTLQAPETAAGRTIRCRACNTPQRVPAGEALSVHLEHQAPRARAAEPVAEEEPRFVSGSVVQCEECRRFYAVTEAVCPDCGRVNARRPAPAVPEAKPQEPPDRARPSEYLFAPLFGLTHARSLLILSGVMLLDLAPLAMLPLHASAARTGMDSPMGGHLPGGFFLLVTFGGLVVQVAVAGYVLQFYLDVVHGAIMGVERAPDAPDFSIPDIWANGMRALGILVLYVAPVVTLPLLPLGLLALAEGDDDQAFDLRWVVRAGLRNPMALGHLFLAPVAWLAALALLVNGLGRVAFLGVMGPWVGWVSALVLAASAHLLWCAVWRSLGLAARRHPRLLEHMPEKGSPPAMLVSVGIALAIAQFVWAIALPRALRSFGL